MGGEHRAFINLEQLGHRDELKSLGQQRPACRGHRGDSDGVNVVGEDDRTGARFGDDGIRSALGFAVFPIERIDRLDDYLLLSCRTLRLLAWWRWHSSCH